MKLTDRERDRVLADFARKLERERDEAREELEAWLSEKGPDGWWVKFDEYKRQEELWTSAAAELRKQLAAERSLLENTIAECDQLRHDYNESRENHWNTLEMLRMAQDQRDALRGMLDAQEARHNAEKATIIERHDKLQSQLAAERALADRLAEDLNNLWHYYSLTGAAYEVVEAALAAWKEARK